MHCFTCGERKIWQNIKTSKNIIKMIVEYTAKRGKVYNFSKNSLPLVFLIHIHKGNTLLKVADEEQTYLFNELKSISKSFFKECKIIS